MTDIPSPCVAVCQIDRESGYCLGCWRTIQEIAGWARFENAERLRIVGELHDRRGTAAPRPRRRNRRRGEMRRADADMGE
ncbi:MAG: DUF1289 domain-containing protein [Nisaea sp.]|jgi:predicted Fe-S protein YdhL (DUF1289 family)|uniref:DUF1289 domain-containing protein n=1 Tax=Nisaea sp. TaxID=2024842 RepID=UPI001B0C1DD6|nr:DUF1289 domain-containing protein [Nisaea sp.]MBO6561391.1 DUF1289 domain-containing protein [Nisaea sp.]